MIRFHYCTLVQVQNRPQSVRQSKRSQIPTEMTHNIVVVFTMMANMVAAAVQSS